jgi:hypothetical protein
LLITTHAIGCVPVRSPASFAGNLTHDNSLFEAVVKLGFH